MPLLLPLAAALLGAAAAPAMPDAPPATSASRGALTAMAGAGPEAPAPETPGSSAAETGLSIAAEEPAAAGRSWFAFPMLFYLPETKLGLAGTAGLHFHASDGAPSSSAFLVAGYTMERQGSVDLSSDVTLQGGTLLSGRFRAVHFPDFFYGIGPSTPEDAREEMTRRFVDLNLVAELPVLGSRLRAGPRLHAKAEEILEADPGGLVDTGGVTGAEGFSAVGLGFNVTWDSRDQPLWPTRGSYAQASYVWYPSSWGRNDGFGRGALEGRLFLPLGRERVLALAAVFEENHGATPFTLLSKLGSTRFLRGIPEGRYRDRLGWAAQAEVRLPLTDKIAGALFGAFGSVAPELGDFDASTLKIAGGAGLRYRLTRQGANLRLDLAASDEGPALYVLLLEAF
jgi:hypothetical protein